MAELALARDQFVQDYTLVIDNDQSAYYEALDTVAGYGVENKHDIANALREQFEAYISEVADREAELGYSVGALLISQMLIGWNSAFEDVAQYYINTVKEAE
jgi:hypothetical protein